ncbi:MAG: hypothetical protein ACFFA5_02850 [Promethearchaeota archaeon]
MTLIAKHLRCDAQKMCIQCSDYLWSPEKKGEHGAMNIYYYCPFCKMDILCERGVGIRFTHDRQGQIGKMYVCIKCGGKLVERIWPFGKDLE